MNKINCFVHDYEVVRKIQLKYSKYYKVQSLQTFCFFTYVMCFNAVQLLNILRLTQNINKREIRLQFNKIPN